MMKRFANIFCIALIVLITMIPAAAAAETATGTGDGSGGGKDIAFALVQTIPQDGATGVNVRDSIWLLFNKNVVNMTVRDINKANIVLRDADGDKVSAKVTMKDDQIEPEYRREIVVDPSSPLEPATRYILTIGSAVQAKNGETLGKSYQVTFTTAGEKPGSATKPTQNQSAGTTKDDVSSGQEENSTGSGNDQKTDKNANDQASPSVGTPSTSGESGGVDGAGQKADGIVLLLAGVVLLGGAATAVIVTKKRDKKNND